MGCHAAKFLSEQDNVRVVAILEQDGGVTDRDGPNVHHVNQFLAAPGGLRGYSTGVFSENGAEALEMACDIPVPAALDSQIHAGMRCVSRPG